MRIVGLTGYAGSGKDYVCDILRAEYYATRVAFADGVRLEVEEFLSPGTQPIEYSSQARLPAVWKKPYPDEIRRLLQWWGTEYRRAEDQDYWVNKGVQRIKAARTTFDLVIVTDVRFQNEADAIRDLGGIVLQVTASQEIRARRLGGSLPPAHASEVIDFGVDGLIRNDDLTRMPEILKGYLTGLETITDG